MAYKYKVIVKITDTDFPVHNCLIRNSSYFHYTDENGEARFYSTSSSITATIFCSGMDSITAKLSGGTSEIENVVYISQKKIGTSNEISQKSNSAYTNSDITYCPYSKILTDNGNFILYDTLDYFKCPTFDKVNYSNAFAYAETIVTAATSSLTINNSSFKYMLSGGTSFVASPTAITLSSGYCGMTFVTSSYSTPFTKKGNLLSIVFNSKTKGTVIPTGFSGETMLESVTFKGKLTIIQDSGFTGCVNLKEINLGNYLTNISASAFKDCKSLTGITLPDSLTGLSIYSFSGCTGLKSITIPKNVTKIPNYCFSGCTGLTAITFEGNIEEIGDGAFIGCKNLNKITFPSSLKKIGASTFDGCSRLLNANLNNGIETLGAGAFSNCTSLQSVLLPSTLTSISNNVFQNCPNITQALIYCNSIDNADALFLDCTLLTDVTLGGKITKIPSYCFDGCTSLETIDIPYSVSSISRNAFYGCTSLKHIVFNDNISEIIYEVCAGCTGLTDIYILGDVSTISIDADAFKNVTQSLNVWSKDSSNLNADFGDCFPSNSTFLDFTVCTHYSNENTLLTAIKSKNSDKCRGYFVDGYGSLYLSESVYFTGEKNVYVADKGYTASTDTVKETTIYSGITTLTTVKIPDHINTIKNSAFNRCTNLSSFEFNDDINTSLVFSGSSFFGCSSLKEINFGKRLGEIGIAAFASCTSLETLTFETPISSIESIIIGSSGFADCSSLNKIYLNSTGVCPIIREDTFKNVKSGGTLYYNSSYEEVSSMAEKWLSGATYYLGFYKWNSSEASSMIAKYESSTAGLKTIYKSGSTINGCTKMRVNGGSQIDVSYQTNLTAGTNTVEFILAAGTTGTTGSLFSGITTSTTVDCCLVSITIPDCITSIASQFCKDCKQLTSLTLPSGVTTINANAFSGCSFETLTIPSSVSSLGLMGAFKCNTSLKTVIDNSSANIAAQTFSGCTNLSSITFNGGPINFLANAFQGCESLTKVDFPSALTNISASAFNKCTGLTELNLSNTSVSAITTLSFSDCTSLEKVYLPSTLTTLSANTFSGCSKLEYIYIDNDSEPTIQSTTFLGVKEYGQLRWPSYVDDETTSAFNTTWLSRDLAYLGYYHWNSVGTEEPVDTSNYLEFTVKGDGSQPVIGMYTPFLNTFNVTDGKITANNGNTYTLISSNNYLLLKEPITDETEVTFKVQLKDETAILDSTFAGDDYTNVISVKLPQTVVTIGEGAFYATINLETINLDNIITIGDNAFIGTKISEFTSTALTSVGDNAFMNCKSLTSVTINNTELTNIPIYCFNGCTNLLSINISGCTGIKTIYSEAFSECNKLTSLTLNEGIEKFEQNIIRGDSALSALTLPSTLITMDSFCLLESGLQDIRIPDSVTGIPYQCFSQCTNLKSAYIGSGCTEIWGQAFKDCRNLTEVDICSDTDSEDSSISKIDDYAFSGCSSLNSIKISSLVVPEIYSKSFLGVAMNGELVNYDGKDYSSWLSTDTYYLGYYNWNAAYEFVITTKPVYDDSGNIDIAYFLVTNKYIRHVFRDQEEITLDDGDTTSIETQDEYSHEYTFQLYTPYIPSDLISSDENCITTLYCNTVKSIDNDAFRGIKNLISIDFGENVTEIGASFNECENLVDINFGRLETIGEYAFSNCTSLTSITIGENVTEIDSYAFFDSGLVSVTLNDNLISIGDYAFGGTKISEITIPENVETIGSGCFWRTNLNYIAVYAPKAPTIKEDTFSGVTLYGTLDIFDDTDYDTYQDLWLSKSSYYLGYYLWNYEGENDVVVRYDKDISTSNYINNLSNVLTITLNYKDNVSADVNSIKTAIKNSETNPAVISYTLTGSSISDGQFSGCTSITRVTSGDYITSIGNSGFLNCTNLYKINLTYFTNIGNSGFSGCTSLSSFNISGNVAKTYGTYALAGTGFNSFDCRNNANLPEGFLYNNTSLTGVNINYSTITSVPTKTFEGCTSLRSITIKSGITSISAYAFKDCTNLGSLVFQSSALTSIGEYAFSGCTTLSRINLNFDLSHIITISNNTFLGVAYNGYLMGNGLILSSYGTWLSKSSYYLGYYNWNYNPSEIEFTYYYNGTAPRFCCDFHFKYGKHNHSAKLTEERGFMSQTCDSFTENGTTHVFADEESLYKPYSISVKTGSKIVFNVKSDVTEIKPCSFAGLYYDWEDDSKRMGITYLFGEVCKYHIYDDAYPTYGWDKRIQVAIPAKIKRIRYCAFIGAQITDLVCVGDIESIGEDAFRNSCLKTLHFYGTVGDFAARSFVRCRYLSDIYLWKNSTPPSISYRAFQAATGYNNKASYNKIKTEATKIHVPKGLKSTYEESRWGKNEDYFPGGYKWEFVDDLPPLS